jgi:hypothetical protein
VCEITCNCLTFLTASGAPPFLRLPVWCPRNEYLTMVKHMGARRGSQVRFTFKTKIIEWRGPAPFFYAPIPAEHVEELRRVAKVVSYGWGVVPVQATIGTVTFTTSLFPKGETYLLPLKVAVRRQANITITDTIAVVMTVQAVRL